MNSMPMLDRLAPVAPYAGAWIETCRLVSQGVRESHVAPYAGAWIETVHAAIGAVHRRCRPLRGGVD